MPEISGSSAETAGWLERLRAGNPDAAPRLIEHTCERLRLIARRMLRRFPQVRRWEETDDVLFEAMTKLCKQRFEEFNTAGKGSKIRPISVAEMAKRYASGALDPKIGPQ